MKTEPLSLVDFKGGLNDRDPASALAPDELQRLENYFTDDKGLLTKRPGKEVLQHILINPMPFVSDINTLGLWHLDETATPYIDSGPGGFNLTAISPLSPTAVAGIFSNAQKFTPDIDSLGIVTGLTCFPAPVIDGLSQICVEGYINIDATFTGKPVIVTIAGIDYDFGNDGASIVGAFDITGSTDVKVTAHRDWDPVAGADSGPPYIRFALQTAGQVGVQSILRSPGLELAKWMHFRCEYDSASGYASMYINGSLVDNKAPIGGGNIATGNTQFLVGVFINQAQTSINVFNGAIDEVRISNIIRTPSFPFDPPRGMGFEFSKSDGTRQAVISATDKLWYTLGDGAYTQMKLFGDLLPGFTTPAFSITAFWDAIFRKDILYLANGVDSPLAWDGATLVYWMAPTTAPVLSLGGIGTITAGTHKVAYSVLYGSYETGLSPSATITNGSGEQINVGSIPPRHANATGIRIYMTKAGADTWYLAREIPHTPGAIMEISGPYTAGSPPGYDTDSGALGPADADLGTSGFPLIETQVFTAVSPNPQFLLAEHDRPFVCGMLNERYTLRWGELGAYDVFNVFSFAQAAANQGNLIGLASYYGEVHCSKDGRATLILRGSNPQNWNVLETLHPSVGSIDHWGYVHRYPVVAGKQSDKYVLCFPARDGFYKYAGQQIECISDKIKGTIARLATANATRNEWDVTTTAQWQAQTAPAAGGTATLNIQAAAYETDGLRETGGTAKIVDQLDYLGLWNNSVPLVTGRVIATEKGNGEGIFYIGNDASNDLFYTTDNFQTKTAVTGNILDAAERIIQIVKQGATDAYFVITDTANADGQSSGGGNIYYVNDPTGIGGIGPAWTKLTSAALYYDLDVPMRMVGGQDRDQGRAIGNLNPPNGNAPYNIFVNHVQKLFFQYQESGINTLYRFYRAANIDGIASTFVYGGSDTASGTVSGVTTDFTVGFYAFLASFLSFNVNNDLSSLFVTFTRREFPRWRGGSFSPQAYWDATNSRLVFLASTAENSSGNRLTYLRTLTVVGVLTNQYTAENVAAFTPAGMALLLYSVNQFVGGFTTGMAGRIQQSTLATPGTIVGSAAYQPNLLALRLSYNSASAATYIGAFKNFSLGASQQFWTYIGGLYTVPTATSIPALLRALTANGDSGSFFCELAVQSTTPFAWYASTSRISSANPEAVWKVSAALALSAYKSEAYESPTGNAAVTGILSNLLFVPASGVTGDYLWSDRLYWYASAAATSDARMLQLGVEGNWTVQGIFQSEQHNLGDFSAFDDLQSAFNNHNNSNGLLFELRNAATAVALGSATYQQQVPNQKITGFAPVLPYVQWRLTFTWVFDSTAGATVTASPSTDFVIIGFFLGQANLPRTVGFHWEGRTFWCCAEDGATQNNVVLVYQKSNEWMKIYGWSPKSIFRFRNQMVSLENYLFVRLMTGRTDAGALIVARARTGTIMGWVDKMICRLQANVLAFANNLFSSLPGYVKLTPYQGDIALTEGAWVIAVPSGTEGEVNRVLGEPDDEFAYPWARAFSMEIKTSEDTTGNWIPVVGQPENIQQIDLELEVTGDAYDIPVK